MTRRPDHWDVIVAGVGAMGSATLFHLARRGCRVLGLERFWVAHDRGSSHGRSRIIRLTAPEGTVYFALARRAYDLWRELERISGERLLRVTGSIDAGPADGELVERSTAACRAHGLEHEVLSSGDLSRRFPAFRLPADHGAVYQPDGGVLDPERCIETYVRFAESLGASLRTGVRVTQVQGDDAGVRVRVRDDEGTEEEYGAGALVLTVGAWSRNLLGPVGSPPLVPERQVMGWFRPFTGTIFRPDRFPAFTIEVPEGRFYGFPDLQDEGFKTGRRHHLEERVDPDRMRRTCSDRDRRVLRGFAERYLPEGAGELERMQACLFTNTPDGHFVLDHVPGKGAVVLGAGFSGHGFKYAPVIGEILADLALEGTTSYELDPFSLGRFET